MRRLEGGPQDDVARGIGSICIAVGLRPLLSRTDRAQLEQEADLLVGLTNNVANR